MLAGLLKSQIAIEVSIKIVEAFVEMRNFIFSHKDMFNRLNIVEYKLLDHDNKFDQIFNALQQNKEFNQKIFFNGQIYDAYSVVIDIIEKAKKDIVIIDNYIDKKILDILVKKNADVNVLIITTQNSKLTELDINKFNEQYPQLKVEYSNEYHDRFIVIDNDIIYHCGTSLKDLGKKTFAINKMEDKTLLKKLFMLN